MYIQSYPSDLDYIADFFILSIAICQRESRKLSFSHSQCTLSDTGCLITPPKENISFLLADDC